MTDTTPTTDNAPPTIPLPERLPGEGVKPYDAFTSYVMLGQARTCEKVAAKYQKSVSLIYRWHRVHDWHERVATYDAAVADQLAAAIVAKRNKDYIDDLEEHRKRYKKVGKDLCTVAQGILATMARAVQGQKIKGEDGKEYIIPAMEMTPNTLSVVARSFTVAADLEAHALGLDKLLPQLDDYE